ncbi:tRNA pseudouridine(55) synthase TruB [Microvirga sp. W0021]|uniref:tRNA pseudouridine synthase B n=1 Tax=Hohaiivirga grylli TaxID=3133970 RepID=A0ABV0BFH4_9HYPH
MTSENKQKPNRQAQSERPKKYNISGWVIVDKDIGVTSTRAVSMVKRILSAKKAGHAGTLDPLASGILPIALGEATKTVPYVMDGEKSYVFTVEWGSETTTDDREGDVINRSDNIPTREEVEALLPEFTGIILQVPPKFSAIKIQGERAYDLARDGEDVELKAREVEIERLELISHEGNQTVIAADCGKGTYIRSIARDMGRKLGCFAHIATLRRTRVGHFTEADAIRIDDLEMNPSALQPVELGLGALTEVTVSRDTAARLMRGQSALLRGRDAPISGKLYATCDGVLIAVGEVEKGSFVPQRVFNLGA